MCLHLNYSLFPNSSCWYHQSMFYHRPDPIIIFRNLHPLNQKLFLKIILCLKHYSNNLKRFLVVNRLEERFRQSILYESTQYSKISFTLTLFIIKT